MSPCPGRRQRSSASAPTTRPLRRVHLGLIQDHQFVAFQRAPQLALQHQPLDRGGIHFGHVEGAGIAAVLLGVVHRRIGVADQIDHVLGVVGTDGDADAGGQVHLLLVDVESAADFIQQGARQGADGRAVVDVHRQIIDEHGELVARQPADDRVLAQIARQPLAQDFQRAVAGGVAEGVVDLLEAVQIQIQQRERALVAARARDRLLQQMLELHAVRHLGERVVARQVADAPLGALALGDVARHVDIALELRVLGR